MGGMKFDFTIKGMADLNRRLEELQSDVATKVGQTAVRAGAKAAMQAMKSDMPVSKVPENAISHRHRKDGKVVDEAHHKIINNMKVSKTKPDTQTAVSVSINVGKAWTARFPEFGTIHQPAQHFMLRSFTKNQQVAIDAMMQSLNRGLIKRGV